MRNLLLIFVLLSLIACNKDYNNPVISDSSQNIHKYLSKSEVFLRNHKTIKPRYKLPKWAKTVLKDILGAMGGATAGAAAGSILPGAGNLIGAGIGAVVGGALASDNAGYMLHPTDYDVNLFTNYSNEYDAAGIEHYNILSDLRSNSELNTTDGEFDAQKSYNYTVNKIIDKDNTEFFNYFDFNTANNICENLPGGNSDEIINYIENLETNPYLSEVSKAIISSYFSVIFSLTNNDAIAFRDYSIDFESEVSNDNDLTDEEKCLLLITLSTARHGVAYWSNIQE